MNGVGFRKKSSRLDGNFIDAVNIYRDEIQAKSLGWKTCIILP